MAHGVTPQLHVGDLGVEVGMTLYTINDLGQREIVDISGSTARVITMQRPDGTTYGKAAVLTTDGTDGKLHFLSEAGDLDVAGFWSRQAYVTFSPTDAKHSEVVEFEVFDNL